MKPITLWQGFQHRWSRGCDSSQCAQAHRIVLAKGQVPCDILVVGEAPGDSEDDMGIPFVKGAPAGGLLHYILEHAIPEQIPEWRGLPVSLRKTRIAYTNMVCCIPRESDGTGKKAGAPQEDQIESCAQRLVDFIVLCDPALIIAVGTLARDYLDTKNLRSAKLYWRGISARLGRRINFCWFFHPSFMLRQNTVVKMRMRKSAIITVADAIDETFGIKKGKEDKQEIVEDDYMSLGGTNPGIHDDDIPF